MALINQERNDALTDEAIAAVDREVALKEAAKFPELTAVCVSAAKLITMALPERRLLLAPWLPAQGLAMVYAPRGIGKTYFALNVAYAIASGGEYLGWQAPEPVNVLYIDGEMPASAMQERLRQIVHAAATDAEDNALRIITPDLQGDRPVPNLSSLAGQEAIEPFLDDVGLVIVDNISTLCRSGAENESESWIPVQAWALRLRARGISVLFVHHAGKGGHQRGTSKREDVLDTVINLKRPTDYTPDQGATFEVHFEKNRGFHGEDAEPLSVALVEGPNGQTWTWNRLEDSTFDKVVDLANEGLSQADIARELDINRSTVSRHYRKAKAQGMVS